MREADLAEAGQIVRLAFGTFLGVPDLESFWADRDYLRTRWHGKTGEGVVAEGDGRLVGSNFATVWGSFGFFGPLTIRPEFWDRGIAQRLLAPTMDIFAKCGVRESGLFTFAQSAKHVGLYQKFGYWPRYLTALMSKVVKGPSGAITKYSALRENDRAAALNESRKLTDSIFDGLDVSCEIRSVHQQNLGDTVLLWGGGSVEGFAVCHCGEGTEAGRGSCYIKFAAVPPGPHAPVAFERLLDACQSLAWERKTPRIQAGMNLSRVDAFLQMQARGYRTDVQGVAMHKPDLPGFNRPDVFVIDDWR
jgi:GNAT superfamily N-acetyltransferase